MGVSGSHTLSREQRDLLAEVNRLRADVRELQTALRQFNQRYESAADCVAGVDQYEPVSSVNK